MVQGIRNIKNKPFEQMHSNFLKISKRILRLKKIAVRAWAPALTDAICSNANKLFSKSIAANFKINQKLATSVETSDTQITMAIARR